MDTEKDTRWFQISIAAAGVIVTALLGFGQWRLSQQQNQMVYEQHKAEDMRAREKVLVDNERLADNIEVQVMTLVAPHLAKLRGSDRDAENSTKIVLAAEEYLSTSYGKTSLAQMHKRIVEDIPHLNSETRTRIDEATEPVAEGAPWYVVLSSLPTTNEGAAHAVANEKLKMAQKIGLSHGIKIYRTKLSNNYAIVLGGQMARPDALSLATIARQDGLAVDAFAQQDRSWVFVGDAPFNQ